MSSTARVWAHCAIVLGYRLTPADSDRVQEKRFGKRNVPATTKTLNFARKLEKTRSLVDERGEHRR